MQNQYEGQRETVRYRDEGKNKVDSKTRVRRSKRKEEGVRYS